MVPFLESAIIQVKMQSSPPLVSPGLIPRRGKKIMCVNNPDVIVVGAGVAGSALARTLAKDGRRVKLIERDLREPNTVSGELLQPLGCLKLAELGLEDCLRDIDSQIVEGYAIFSVDGKSVKLPYPSDKLGRSFHHGRFVQKLRSAAASHPNVKMEEGTVSSLIEEGGEIRGVNYKTSNGDELRAYAPLTIVSDGRFSALRKKLSKPKINKPSSLAYLTLENCKVPHPNYGHVIMGNPSTLMFYALTTTEVRFIIDFPARLPPIANGAMARFLKTVIAPQVPEDMYEAVMSSIDKEGGIRTMPVSCMPAFPCLVPGAILLGDALNMRHAITGGGMTIAIHDVALLSTLLSSLDLRDTSTLIKYTRHFYNMRKPVVFGMNVIAGALHRLLCASPHHESRIQLQSAFFSYLSLGGIVVRSQSLLISGLNSNPMALVLNLLAASIYVIGAMLFPFPSPKKLYALAQLVLATTAGVIPMILDEGPRQVFFTTKAYIPKSSISMEDSKMEKLKVF